MAVLDTLVVMGLAIAPLDTVREASGPVERTFCLRNAGTEAVCLAQGYTSCGCTTIQLPLGKVLSPGDTAHVQLRFNPQGKSGPFTEVGYVAYRPAEAGTGSESGRAGSASGKAGAGSASTLTKGASATTWQGSGTAGSASGKAGALKYAKVTLKGYCRPSEESLRRQFPIHLTASTWLSTDRFDLGHVRLGEERTVYVSILHRDDDDLREPMAVTFRAEGTTGLRHVAQSVTTYEGVQPIHFDIHFDVIVKP